MKKEKENKEEENDEEENTHQTLSDANACRCPLFQENPDIEKDICPNHKILVYKYYEEYKDILKIPHMQFRFIDKQKCISCGKIILVPDIYFEITKDYNPICPNYNPPLKVKFKKVKNENGIWEYDDEYTKVKIDKEEFSKELIDEWKKNVDKKKK